MRGIFCHAGEKGRVGRFVAYGHSNWVLLWLLGLAVYDSLRLDGFMRLRRNNFRCFWQNTVVMIGWCAVFAVPVILFCARS